MLYVGVSGVKCIPRSEKSWECFRPGAFSGNTLGSAQTDTQRVSICLPLPDYSYINSAGLHMQLVDSTERKNLVLYRVGAQHAEISKLAAKMAS